MDESVIYKLDKAYIVYADISFNPYTKHWPDGKITTTGWLQELTIEIEENYLQDKYAEYDEVDSTVYADDEDIPF